MSGLNPKEPETTPTEKSALDLVQEEKQKKDQAQALAEQLPKAGIWHRIHEALQEHPFYGPVTDVLYWRDLVRSGLIFSIGCFFFFLVIIGEYSTLTLGSYMMLTVLLVSYGYIKFQTMRGGENPFRDRLQHAEIATKEQVERHVESLWKIIETTKGVLIDVFFTADLVLTLRAASIFFILSLLGKWFQSATLFFVVFVFLFTWPRLYEEKREQIDALWDKISTPIAEKINLILSKVSFGKKKKD
jgi:hypothetical protein